MKTIFKFIAVIFFTIMIFSFGSCSGGAQKSEGGGIDVGDVDLGTYPPALMTKQPFNDTNAVEFVSGIKIGWNLGNTLDAIPWDGYYSYNPNPDVYSLETLWVKHETTPENIAAIKKAGFNLIRIPVSWSKAVDNDFNIRKDWMERVTEIVNYAVAENMYIILNTHHDESIFKFKNSDTPASLRAFKKIWLQIASQFKNYNERLIFEGLNEPRTKGSAGEWNGGSHEERLNINKHYEVFVDAVRSTGGNNDKRFLMVNTYGASTAQAAVSGLVLPQDKANKKLIVSVHAYSPYNFALNVNSPINTWNKNNASNTSDVKNPIDSAYNKFVKNGIPVIIGEFGAINKDNEPARAEWAEFFTGYAREKNIPCVWWDNGGFEGSGELFGLLYREEDIIEFPILLEGLMRGAGVK